MIVEAPAEFWDWLAALATRASAGDGRARERHDLALALLTDLDEMRFQPDRAMETATFSRIREASRHPIWRISAHAPSGAWVRLRCAFPVGTRAAVIVSSSGDLVRIGDLFHRSVAAQTDALVEHWLRDRATGRSTAAPGLTRAFEPGDEHIAMGLAQMGTPQRVAAVRDDLRLRDSLRMEKVRADRQSIRV
ncbi:hypothetical protein [Nocardioides gilvus]|uniref:hypothetical protein n=1 Tax=Nocardioides gilvus TaxID=1735589 RepID=UPI000D74AFFA|nr:hypothetical protein [Nocardioides gilvus]